MWLLLLLLPSTPAPTAAAAVSDRQTLLRTPRSLPEGAFAVFPQRPDLLPRLRSVIVCAGSARCCSGGRNGKASCEKKAAAAAPNNHRSRPCGFSFSLSLFPSSEADLSMRCLASGSAQESAERARKRELRGRESLALPRAIYQRRSRPRSPPPLLAAAAAALFSMRPSSRALSVACVLCKLSAS